MEPALRQPNLDPTFADDLGALYSEESGLFHKLVEAVGLDPKIDFRRRDLRGVQFVGADLRGFDLSGSDLRGTFLRFAKLLDRTTGLTGAVLDPEDREWLDGQNQGAWEAAKPGRGFNVEDEARRLILNGLTPPAAWRPFIRRLSFVRRRIENVRALESLINLQSLELQGTWVSDLAALNKLSNLEHLSLHFTRVRDLSPLAGLTKLLAINLRGTMVEDVEPLGALESLKSLNLRGTLVHDLTPLAGLRALEVLDVRETPVTDVSPLEWLSNLTIRR